MHIRRRAWAALVVFVAACGANADDEASRGATSSPIIRGTASDASQDAVVLVLHRDPKSKSSESCTGTLLAPRLVLTSRHCVAHTDTIIGCTSDGTATDGAKIYFDYDAADLYVFAGSERPIRTALEDWQRGSAIIDDGARTLCNHDIALLLLADPVPDAKIAPVRLAGGPRADEAVTLVGWGVADASSAVPTTRRQGAGKVLGVGPSRDAGIGSAEFLIGEGPCEGDSGGPALSASGAVIGLLSRGGRTDVDGFEGCVGATNVYTATSSFEDLILAAYAQAGQAPFVEAQGSAPKAAATSAAPPSNHGGCATAAPGGADGLSTAMAIAECATLWLLHRRRGRRQPRRGRRRERGEVPAAAAELAVHDGAIRVGLAHVEHVVAVDGALALAVARGGAVVAERARRDAAAAAEERLRRR